MEIKSKLKDDKEHTIVNYNFPSDLKGLTEKFGADVVFGKAMDSLVIDVQALVRRHLKGSTDKDGKVTTKPKTQAEIQEIVKAWIPGVGAVRKSPVEKVGTLIGQMSAEEKAALLKQLQAK